MTVLKTVLLLRHLLSQSYADPTGLTASVTSSDSFYNDSTLTCSASASDIDPEDAALTYTYLWSTGDTGGFDVGWFDDAGQVSLVQLRLPILHLAGKHRCDQNIVESAPTVSSVTIDPGMAYYTDSTFNASVTLDDADTTSRIQADPINGMRMVFRQWKHGVTQQRNPQ